MTDYENAIEVGLYREETGLTCGSGQIAVSAPVAWNCHTDFQNKPHATETFKLGVAWLRNVTDSTWNTSDVSAVSGSTITIGATHNGDEFNIGYYARGTGVTAASQAVQDGDYWRAEHVDTIYKAYNKKGNIDPTECGYVYDQVMAYASVGAISTTEVTAVRKQEENVDGTWSFTNEHAYYVTAVRVEVKDSVLQSGKGIRFYVKEAGDDLLYNASTAGQHINDGPGWFIYEYNDGVETWLVATTYLGMMLCGDFKVTVKTYNGNTDIAADNCYVFVSGWHIPDPVPESEGAIISKNQDLVSSFAGGNYRVACQEVDGDVKVRFNDNHIAFHTTEVQRTNPHYRGDFFNGVEYVKNLTTDQFVTTAITRLDYRDIHFDGTMVATGDVVEVGYYCTGSEFASKLAMAAGDLMERATVDGIVQGAKRLDRVDFGKTNFPYGDGEYKWHYGLWQHIVVEDSDYFVGSELTNAWQTLISFDVVSFESRTFHQTVVASGTPAYNETPFYLTGISITMAADAISGGSQTFDQIMLRLTINGTPAGQAGGTSISYIPMAHPATFVRAPAPNPVDESWVGVSGDNYDTHQFYIPLGIVRCYGFKLDARLEAAEAFTKVEYSLAYVEGWIPDSVVRDW